MVVKGKTQKPIPAPLEEICRKNELKLLGIAFKIHVTGILSLRV